MVGLAKVGSEFLVNATTLGSQTDPAVAGLASGDVAFTWIAADNTGALTRSFTSAGVAKTGELLVVGTVSRLTFDPTTFALDGGGYVSFAHRGSITGFALEGREFDADGNFVQLLSVATGPTLPNDAEVTVLDSGQVLVSYTLSGAATDLQARQFSLSSPGSQTIFNLNSVTAGSQRNSDVAALASGGFVAVWEDDSGTGGDASGFGIKARIFDNAGQPTAVEFLVNSSTANDQINAAVAALGSGFVAVWQDATGTSIMAQIFDAAGNKVGGEILVNTTTLNDQVTPTVAAIGSGGFAVAWTDTSAQNGDTSGSAIRVQSFDNAGTKVGGETLVNTTVSGNQTAPALSAVGDDGLIIAWTDASATGGDTDGSAIRAQFLRVDRSDTQIGGPGDNVYLVDDPDDVIVEAANGGSDTVYTSTDYRLGANLENLLALDAFATNGPSLFGNALNNTIYGDYGANQIDGGTGIDFMIGWSGDDVYYVDNVGDVVSEKANDGFDYVYTSVSNTRLPLAANVEVLLASNRFDTTPLELRGNAINNIIYGNDGANIIFGFEGDDFMIGWGGNDVYSVQQSGDIVYEEAGGGSDEINAEVDYALPDHVEILRAATPFTSAVPLILIGNGLDNTISGNLGANQIDGRGGADVMIGREGDDVYYVDDAGDIVTELANQGLDYVYTTRNYTLADNAEILLAIDPYAATAIDLTGNGTSNVIYGNAGASRIDGRAGGDDLIGLGGADSFAFTTALGNGNIDRIIDFAPGVDDILLDRTVFTGLNFGTLAAGAFRTGGSAQDADDRILHDPTSGALYFDADGNGAAAAVQFASVSTGLALSSTDFLVI